MNGAEQKWCGAEVVCVVHVQIVCIRNCFMLHCCPKLFIFYYYYSIYLSIYLPACLTACLPLYLSAVPLSSVQYICRGIYRSACVVLFCVVSPTVRTVLYCTQPAIIIFKQNRLESLKHWADVNISKVSLFSAVHV